MEYKMTTLRIFDDNWKFYFKKERDNLLELFKKQDISAIEHIGSTSVVMCKAAGTIDILVSIPDTIEMFTIKNILVSNGYKFIDSMSDMDCFVFMRVYKGKVVCTIRVMEHASEKYNDFMLFKYYLRSNRMNVKKYNEFREKILAKFNGDGKRYYEEKINYITNKVSSIKPQN